MPNATEAVLVLLTVTVCAALVPPLTPLNVRLVLLTVIGAVPAVAFDVSLTTRGSPPGASSVIMMAPSSTAEDGVT